MPGAAPNRQRRLRPAQEVKARRSLAAVFMLALAALAVAGGVQLSDEIRMRRPLVLPDGSAQKLDLSLKGRVDKAALADGQIVLTGWAVDLHSLRPPKSIVVYVNGKQWTDGVTDVDRADVVRSYVGANMLKSGFSIALAGEAMK